MTEFGDSTSGSNLGGQNPSILAVLLARHVDRLSSKITRQFSDVDISAEIFMLEEMSSGVTQVDTTYRKDVKDLEEKFTTDTPTLELEVRMRQRDYRKLGAIIRCLQRKGVWAKIPLKVDNLDDISL